MLLRCLYSNHATMAIRKMLSRVPVPVNDAASTLPGPSSYALDALSPISGIRSFKYVSTSSISCGVAEC